MVHRGATTFIGHKADIATIDTYLAASAKGPGYRRRMALAAWQDLTPTARLELQQASRSLAGNDMELSQAITQSILLLDSLSSSASEG